ncbi:MAG TPA: RnfH family protein [Burkholderiaceae bacterium]|nr:RnfH family protein [Burkholderiaceae bacterium]
MQQDKTHPIEHIEATVVWAGPAERPREVTVRLPPGSTLAQAAQASGLLADSTGPIDLGVYNRVQTADTLLRQGDRVELYRPLQIDPKTARRIRAQVRQRRSQINPETAKSPKV